jgi:dTDP-4-amino-4,6-dideoxygalactose transaminase
MVLLSGSYMHYDRHRAAPPPGAFEDLKLEVPNISGRMDNLRAAILRPQLRNLPTQCARWTERYRVVEAGLRGTPGLTVIERPEEERFVGSSIQFLLEDWAARDVREVVGRCRARGVELKWFGSGAPSGYTSTYRHWRFADPGALPETDRILAGLIDMRLPLVFTIEDCETIARIIRSEVGAVWQGHVAAE